VITHPKVEQYIEKLIPERSIVKQRLELEGSTDGIPNILLSSAQFLRVLLMALRPKRILEIGTAIGYSAITMAEVLPDAKIVTIEKDEERAGRAMNNFREAGVSGRVQLLEGDALDLIPSLYPFDFIFIDAAKGQYDRFLELSLQKLNEGGVILSDNVLFRGLVADMDEVNEENAEKKYRNMIHKLRGFNHSLAVHPELETSWIPIGDGIALSYKRGAQVMARIQNKVGDRDA
jgi:predicted O-methyltransferase YrrM